MKVFVYHSELTHRTIVTLTDHGKAWVMPDDEGFDLVQTIEKDTDVIVVYEDFNIGKTTEAEILSVHGS